MVVAVEVAVVQQQELVESVEQERQEQSLSTGNLTYKMYAVIKDGIVLGYQWDNKPTEGLEFVLMTLENSPAHVGGTYKNGMFYNLEGEQNG